MIFLLQISKTMLYLKMACLYCRWVLYSIQKDFFMSAIFTKDFFTHMYRRKNFVPRLLLVLFAVILMGFCLSWLVLCDMGTDPCTMMNLAISDKLGMAIGDWQALMNIVLLIFVIIFGGKLGVVTVLMAFVLGPVIEFVGNLLQKVIEIDE